MPALEAVRGADGLDTLKVALMRLEAEKNAQWRQAISNL
jgi:hypothetical protein